MSIFHSKSLTEADQTGVVTVGFFPQTSTVNATDIVRPTDWNSQHNLSYVLAGNTAGVSAVSGSDVILAGGANITLSATQGVGVATISIVGGAGGGGAGSVSFSAGGSSANLGSLVFSNGSGVSFGLNGSTITASVGTIPSTAGLISAINISGGTTSNNLTQLSFANGNGVSFGLNGSTLTASVAAAAGANTMSYFENYNVVTNVGTGAFSNSTSSIQPFIMPMNISHNYIRLLGSISDIGGSTSFGTSVNTTVSAAVGRTIAYGIYTQNTGASSLSLSLLTSGSVGSTISWEVSANANGSEYTVTNRITYPDRGGTSASSVTYASTQTRVALQATVMSLFTGFKGLDIPTGQLLAGSNYFIMVGVSSSTAGTIGGGPRNGVSMLNFVGLDDRLENNGVNAGANSSNWDRLGLGMVSSNAAGVPAAFALANITTQVSQSAGFLFQMVRQA